MSKKPCVFAAAPKAPKVCQPERGVICQRVGGGNGPQNKLLSPVGVGEPIQGAGVEVGRLEPEGASGLSCVGGVSRS